MAINVLQNRVPPVPPLDLTKGFDPVELSKWLLIVQQQMNIQAAAIKELQNAVGI